MLQFSEFLGEVIRELIDFEHGELPLELVILLGPSFHVGVAVGDPLLQFFKVSHRGGDLRTQTILVGASS